MRGRVMQRLHDESGAIAILVALFSVVMFVFAALIVDLGVARTMRRDAQNAADASALAAAGALYRTSSVPDFTAAVTAAKDYAAANYGTPASAWLTCSAATPLSYLPAGTSCISFDSAVTPSTVRVVVPGQQAESFFGGVVGYTGMSVDAMAEAQVYREQRPVCAFCVIGPGPHDFQNGDLTITNGDIWANGSITLGPQSDVAAVNGTVHVQGSIDAPSQVSNPKVIGDAAVADPLAYLAVPPPSMALLPAGVKTNPCTQGPGFYGAVSLTGSGTCTLTAGLYVFTDPFKLGGGHALVANGVTLYFTCGTAGIVAPCAADPASPGTLDVDGSGGFALTAPTSGPLKGLAIVYDRTDPATLSLSGSTSGGTLVGTIYAPSASLDLRGNGCGTTFRSMVVLRTLDYSGNPSCFNSLYSAADNVDLPPSDSGLVL